MCKTFNRSRVIFYSLFIVTIIQIASCQKEISSLPPSSSPSPIAGIVLTTAKAGPDQTIFLPVDSGTLNGSGSTTANGSIISFAWAKINGPTQGNIKTPDKAITVINNLTEGQYFFRLTVVDNKGTSADDTVIITVKPPAPCSPLSFTNINPYPGSTYIADMSEARFGSAIVSINNKIFIAGGVNGCSSSQTLDIVDLTNSTVTTKKLSVAHFSGAIAASNNKVFYAGGTSLLYSSISPTDIIDVYDTSTDLMNTMKLSIARASIATASVGDIVLFAGGFTGSIASSRVDIYNTKKNTWSTAELSEARINMAVAIAGNKVFFAGGANAGASKTIDIYDYSSNSWSTNQLPAAGYFNADVINNKIYFVGGTGDRSNVYVLDITTNQWSSLQLSESKFVFQIGISNDKIAFIGGAYDYFTYSKKIEIYNTITNTWSYQYLTNDISNEAVISIGNNIYSVGGIIDNDNNDKMITGIIKFVL